MDFYAVKFLAVSNMTGENYVGYIFGKRKQEPTVAVGLLNKNALREYKIPDVTRPYLLFRHDVDFLTYELFNDLRFTNINRQFSTYFISTIKKYGIEIISTKMYIAVQEQDPFLLRALIEDILEDWAGECEVKVVAEGLYYEDMTVVQAQIKSEDDSVYDYLQRLDVVDNKVVFPVVDPIDGLTISKLDVGDPFFILETTEDNTLRKEALEATLLSKEIIPNSDYLFLKVLFNENILGKTVVPRSLKIMIDKFKFDNARRNRDGKPEDNNFNVIKSFSDNPKQKKAIDLYQTGNLKLADLIIISSISVIGLLFLILIGVWLGAF